MFAQKVDCFRRSKKDPIDVNDELLKNTMLETADSTLSGFLEIMLAPTYDGGITPDTVDEAERRRRKRKKQQQQQGRQM